MMLRQILHAWGWGYVIAISLAIYLAIHGDVDLERVEMPWTPKWMASIFEVMLIMWAALWLISR